MPKPNDTPSPALILDHATREVRSAESAPNPTPAAPKSAHLTLAEAAEGLLNLTIPEGADAALGRLELSVRNYRFAEKAAQATPFGSVVKLAIQALDEGNIEAARKCMNVLLMATDYVPLIDVDAVTAPREP